MALWLCHSGGHCRKDVATSHPPAHRSAEQGELIGSNWAAARFIGLIIQNRCFTLYVRRFHCCINNNKSMPGEWKSVVIKGICVGNETVWAPRGPHNEDVTIFIYKLLVRIVLYYPITWLLEQHARSRERITPGGCVQMFLKQRRQFDSKPV